MGITLILSFLIIPHHVHDLPIQIQDGTVGTGGEEEQVQLAEEEVEEPLYPLHLSGRRQYDTGFLI